jgi:DNA-binding transcriptional ArsR family regulator
VSEVGDARLAAVAKLFADDTRAAFCAALLDGSSRTAGELARYAGVAASTASEHLSQLVAGGMLEATKLGRHRYFRLASDEVAAALEALAVVAPTKRVSSLRQATVGTALREGRTCYDHLAGRLGVVLTDALIARGIVTPDFAPGDLSPLERLGIEMPPGSSRPSVRPCLDWTERRHHVAGALPAAFTRRLFELNWVQRTTQHRGVRVTEIGHEGLSDLLRAQIPSPQT